jgi:hypothetical protein
MQIWSYLIGVIAAFPNIGTSSGMYSHRVKTHFKMNPRYYKNKCRISNGDVIIPDIDFVASLRNLRIKVRNELKRLKEEVRLYN